MTGGGWVGVGEWVVFAKIKDRPGRSIICRILVSLPQDDLEDNIHLVDLRLWYFALPLNWSDGILV